MNRHLLGLPKWPLFLKVLKILERGPVGFVCLRIIQTVLMFAGNF